MLVRSLILVLVISTASLAHAQAPTPTSQPPADTDTPAYEEQVIVTASKAEEQLVNAPAAVSVPFMRMSLGPRTSRSAVPSSRRSNSWATRPGARKHGA